MQKNNEIRKSKLCGIINSIKINFLTFGYAMVGSEWQGEIFNPFYSRLYYITDGSAYITAKNGIKYELKKGKWYLIPAGYSFVYSCKENLGHYFFHIKLTDVKNVDLLGIFNEPLILSSDEKDIETIKMCIEKDDVTHGVFLKQIIYKILLNFIFEYNLEVKVKQYSQCILKAVSYINVNLSMKLTIPEIAENIFVSESTLTKHFRKELSMSVNEYICELIMSDSVQMLMNSNLSIQAISEKYGFYDQFYFSRKFKEKFGLSPREYRKNNFAL